MLIQGDLIFPPFVFELFFYKSHLSQTPSFNIICILQKISNMTHVTAGYITVFFIAITLIALFVDMAKSKNK